MLPGQFQLFCGKLVFGTDETALEMEFFKQSFRRCVVRINDTDHIRRRSGPICQRKHLFTDQRVRLPELFPSRGDHRLRTFAQLWVSFFDRPQ